MRAAIWVAGLLLWQAGDLVGVQQDAATIADPAHLRYERTVSLPGGGVGGACVVLDATTFAHAASRSGDDLRVFGEGSDGKLTETPFVFNENSAQPVEVETAAVQNLGERGGNIVFDLAMPQRAYSEVDLQLDAKDFLATAKVWGSDGKGGPTTSMGSFALFDLSGQHLSRSTALPLQEATFARLHVELHVTNSVGGTYVDLAPAMVTGASVPASREAQTLYTVVASSDAMKQEGTATVARLNVPEHVPIERVNFVLAGDFKKEFLRGVEITSGKGEDAENVEGEISRVTRPGMGGEPAIHAAKLSVDAVMASNLRGPATVAVVVRNGNDAPLPIKAVQLAMRQRTVCFDALAGKTYTLRYGDVALHAPVYDFARLYANEAMPLIAVLGPETLNAGFRARADTRPYTERHPEILWIGLLTVVAALGTTAMHSVKQQGRKI